MEPARQPDAQPGARYVSIKRPTGRPIVTYIILGVTIFVYILQELTRMGIAREPFLALGQLVFGQQLLQELLTQGWGDSLLTLLGGKITSLIEAGQYWRLITPVLLHASLVHIGFNMYALFAIGPSLESYYGHKRFLALYLLTGFGGNLLSFLLSSGISVGASTAIFGLVAAEGVFIYQNRKIFGPQARAMLSNVVMVVIINLVLGLSPGIDNWGHLGGLITGLLFGWFAGPQLEVTYNYPDYELVDQRSPVVAWVTAVVLFFILIGVVFLRIFKVL
jgi:rhomboid protease GluP